METCNLVEGVDLKYKFVCSQHFHPDDFYTPHQAAKIRLKRNALPSKHLINNCIPKNQTNTEDLLAMPSTSSVIIEGGLENEDENMPCYIPEENVDIPSASTLNLESTSSQGKKKFI